MCLAALAPAATESPSAAGSSLVNSPLVSRWSCSSSVSRAWSCCAAGRWFAVDAPEPLARRRAARERLELDGVPDEVGVGVGVEEELGRVVLVDVTDESVVDAVADELA